MKGKTLGFLMSGCLAAGFAAAGVFVAASPARAQFVPSYAEQRMHETFEAMRYNVQQISQPASERERWDANVAMWDAVLNHLRDTPNTNTKLLKDTLRFMEGNVNQVTEPSERERWTDNIALWRLMIARLDDPVSLNLGLAQMQRALGEMDANVCCIVEAREHDRWQANHDLWQLLVARWANQMPIPTT